MQLIHLPNFEKGRLIELFPNLLYVHNDLAILRRYGFSSISGFLYINIRIFLENIQYWTCDTLTPRISYNLQN